MSEVPALLRVESLTVSYGQVEALRDVGLSVGRGEAVALVGANGAGKSTLLKSIIGLIYPRSGTIMFAGEPLEP